jgi:hypothetical protein
MEGMHDTNIKKKFDLGISAVRIDVHGSSESYNHLFLSITQ